MLDRDLQRALLQDLRSAYPGDLDWGDGTAPDVERRVFNIHYLHEHGLVEAQFARDIGTPLYLVSARITARGLDFLEEDGGLGAILGVVTMRIEADSIRDLIAARIDASDAPEDQKSALKKHLKDLPETALKEGTKELVKEGLKHLPAAVPWLQRWLGL